MSVKGEVFSCEQLDNGNIIVGNASKAQILEVDSKGKVVHTVPLAGTPGHLNHRKIRATSSNTFLVGHIGENVAREYDRQGNVVNTFTVPGMNVYMAARLKNGNTLVSYKTGVVEFSPQGKIVWDLNVRDIPQIKIYWITCVRRLKNGNTLIANWMGHGKGGTGTPLFEVDKAKKVVWTFPQTGPITAVTEFAILKNIPERFPGSKELRATLSLRAAIEDLIKTFGSKYPNGKEYLKRLDKAKGADFAALKREALLANPLVSGRPILYVARNQYPVDHHNTANIFQTDEINTEKYKGRGYLKTVDFSKGGETTTLLDPGATSIPRDPEISFDGKKIIFSLRRSRKDNYHIYEINTDGSELKQLTSAPGVFDIDPLYLADGRIVFSSSREPKYCMCNRHIMGNLFKMEADGANIHQLGKSTLFEGHSSLMPDGNIMYYRWEYVDRNFGDAQGLWVVNPDGSNHAVYWANNTGSPGGVLDGRMIPDTQLCISTFSSCHDVPWGAIAIIDRRKGIDTADAVVKIWPESARRFCNPNGKLDDFKSVKPKYEDPYPLNKNYFLASKRVGRKMAMVLLDMFGNELVIHNDSQGCFDPMPITPRKRPRVKPDMRDYTNGPGTFYVQDAYIGTHMKGVKPGEIKYLRVVESPPKKNWTHPAWAGEGVHCPGMNWHSFENKRILGTVPVEEDGSVHFECPSDTFVFFQLLDKDGMMIHSMRSGTMIQSSERQGCIGCHENRVGDVPPITQQPLALKRKPNTLTARNGKPRIFSFQKEVQPIFDKHCVTCHDFNKPAGRKLILAGDRTHSFSASYIDLWSRSYVTCIGGGPAAIQQAKSWGSHPSKLIKVLREGHPKHKGMKLTSKELSTIITWIDLNAPYYPYYESAYPDNFLGRSPLNDHQLNRLIKLTGARFVKKHGPDQRAQLSFERPELSPCLQKLDKRSAEYKEARAIIQAGKEQLKKVPRADMVGFVPCAKDQQRLRKYDKRCAIELMNRKAISIGKKLYDKDFSKK